MPTAKGKLVLMGSGELTTTMVEVHKHLLARIGGTPQAVFLDTPAGFQLNVDQIAQKACAYFDHHVQHALQIASFKSHRTTPALEAEQAFRTLRLADYVLMGPGSPTYAVRQLQPSPIPEILMQRIDDGGCLVAASAAALTVGAFTLPVYEIYKVGQDIHWVEGMNIMAHFGFNLVVIPHWNNAEGGTHDTRFCFMGEPRFTALEQMLPEEVAVLGLDEHTACLIDFTSDAAVVRGLGSVSLRRAGKEMRFSAGDHIPLDVLRGAAIKGQWNEGPRAALSASSSAPTPEQPFWETIHDLEADFQAGLAQHDMQQATNALLEFDRFIWLAQRDTENEEFVSQARDAFRDQIAMLGTRLAALPKSREACLTPVVEALLALRQDHRDAKQWDAADAIRKSLENARIFIEDTPQQTRWRLTE
jgi:hypothetical protein